LPVVRTSRCPKFGRAPTQTLVVDPAVEVHGERVVAAPGDVLHPGERDDPLGHGARGHGRHRDVDVVDQLAAPAHAAGDFGRGDAGNPAQRGGEGVGLPPGVMEQVRVTGAAQPGDAAHDARGGLVAEARQPGDAAVLRRDLQLRHGGDAELRVQGTHAGHAQAADAQHLDQAGGDFVLQRLEDVGAPGGFQLAHHGEGARADAGGVAQRSRPHRVPDVAGGNDSTACAAFRKARTRNSLSPLSSR